MGAPLRSTLTDVSTVFAMPWNCCVTLRAALAVCRPAREHAIEPPACDCMTEASGCAFGALTQKEWQVVQAHIMRSMSGQKALCDMPRHR